MFSDLQFRKQKTKGTRPAAGATKGTNVVIEHFNYRLLELLVASFLSTRLQHQIFNQEKILQEEETPGFDWKLMT